MAVASFHTEIKFDWGTVVHFLYGLLSGWLGAWQSAVATFIFIFKQALDVKGGENTSETSGDIAEFASGLLVGWLLARLGQTGRLPMAIQLVILVLIAIVATVSILLLHKWQIRF